MHRKSFVVGGADATPAEGADAARSDDAPSRRDDSEDLPAFDETSDGRDASYRSLTHRQRSAVSREIDHLMQQLARGFSEVAAALPERGLTIQRAPHRSILQARERAVTVSWFPASYPEQSLGELHVLVWVGVVSVPGGTQRARGGASIVESSVFHLVWSDGAAPRWQLEEDGASWSTESLAERCLARLEQVSAP